MCEQMMPKSQFMSNNNNYANNTIFLGDIDAIYATIQEIQTAST